VVRKSWSEIAFEHGITGIQNIVCSMNFENV
jgi:hypothetical protein